MIFGLKLQKMLWYNQIMKTRLKFNLKMINFPKNAQK